MWTESKRLVSREGTEATDEGDEAKRGLCSALHQSELEWSPIKASMSFNVPIHSQWRYV